MANNISIFLTINEWCAQLPDMVWMTLCLFGSGWAIFALTSPSIVLAPRLFVALVIGAPISGLLSRVLKMTLEAPRPPAVLPPESFHLIGNALKTASMPSGHTLTAFMVATTIYLSIDKPYRWRFSWLFFIAAAAGVARIAVGVHWFEDILAGAILGMLAGFIGVVITHKLPAKVFQPTSLLLRSLSLLCAATAYMLLTQSMDFDGNRPTQFGLAIIAIASFISFWFRSIMK